MDPSENFIRVVGDGLVRRLGLLDLVLIDGSGDRRKLEEERSQPKLYQNPRAMDPLENSVCVVGDGLIR